MELSEITWHDELCLMAGVPPPVKRRDTLIIPFDSMVWFLAAVTMIGSIAFLFLYIWSFQETSEVGFGDGFMYLWASVFQEPGQSMNYVTSNGLRCFLLIFSFTFLVLSQSYSGNLVSFLTIPPKSPIMTTLADLADSPLPVIQIEKLKEDPRMVTNPDKRRILKKIVETQEMAEQIPKIINREAILFGSKDFHKYAMRENNQR